MIADLVRQQAPMLWIGTTYLLGKEVRVDAHLCRDTYPKRRGGPRVGLYELVGKLSHRVDAIKGLEFYVDKGLMLVFFGCHFKARFYLVDMEGNIRSTGPLLPVDDSMGGGFDPDELWLIAGGSPL